MSKQLKLSTLCIAALLSTSAFANHHGNHGFVSDDSTKDVTLNNFGECWKTTYSDVNSEKNLRGDCKPAPVAPVVTAPPVETLAQFTLGADGLFDFNKATLLPITTQELNNLTNTVRQYGNQVNVSKVMIIGRTDSIGTEAYNLKLSVERAEAVKAYLVRNGVNPALIQTQGLGESEATMTAECLQGKTIRTKAQIAERNACLQPDRNVTISIEGTRIVEVTEK